MYVETDYRNLRIAAREAFEEGWAFDRAQRTLRYNRVPDRAEHLRRVLPARTLAAGYYEWIDYLIWLAGMHDAVPFRELLACEAEGIKIIHDARGEFLRKRVRCPRCGAL